MTAKIQTSKDQSDARPDIRSISTGAELRRWYWRKDELIERARQVGLKTSSGKFVILNRIAHFLDTGEKECPGDRKTPSASQFDWHSAELSENTFITDNYKNTQNVRRFFKNAIDDSFKFNIAFMDWIKANVGKTLGEACTAYLEFRNLARKPDFRTSIKSHNQFNQYTRDFLDDHPELGMDDVRKIWALKILKPSENGRHIYERSDLDLER